MRTLVGSTSTGVAAAVTLPGYLIEIGFTTPLRISTRGTLTWDSKSWAAADARVSGLSADGSASSLNGALDIGNFDTNIGGLGSGMGVLVLAEGVAGRACSIWAYYGDTAPAAGDPVKVFSGVCDAADIPSDGPVRITLAQSGGRTLYCPRTYLTADSGFSYLPTPGQLVRFNGETIRLEAEGF